MLTPLCLSLAFLMLLIPEKATLLYFILPLISIFNGLTFPNIIALVSNRSPQELQGEMLGINQSFQSLAMIFPPIIAGLIVSLHLSLPILVASFCTFLAWLVYTLFYKRDLPNYTNR